MRLRGVGSQSQRVLESIGSVIVVFFVGADDSQQVVSVYAGILFDLPVDYFSCLIEKTLLNQFLGLLKRSVCCVRLAG